MPYSSCLRACNWRWRTWSMARCLAAVINQAAGLLARPRGQRSNADNNVLRQFLGGIDVPVMRARRASNRGDSIRHRRRRGDGWHRQESCRR
jgi:hypothetical protein